MDSVPLSERRMQSQLKLMMETEEERQYRLKRVRDNQKQRRAFLRQHPSFKHRSRPKVEKETRLQKPVGQPEQNETLPKRRGRGRPRKNPLPEQVSQKIPQNEVIASSSQDTSGNQTMSAVKDITEPKESSEEDEKLEGPRKRYTTWLKMFPQLAELGYKERQKQIRSLRLMMETEEERTLRIQRGKEERANWYRNLTDEERKKMYKYKTKWRRQKQQKEKMAKLSGAV